MLEPSETMGVRDRKRGPKKAVEISRLKKEVISKLCAGCSYTKAAAHLSIERNTIKAWRRNDKQFEAACEYARQMTIERVEDAMYEAALKVEENPRYTTAAIFWLKNRSSGRWRDVQNVKHTDEYAERVANMSTARMLQLIQITSVPLTTVTAKDLEHLDKPQLEQQEDHPTSYDELEEEDHITSYDEMKKDEDES